MAKSYNKAARAEAARKGWEKRRQNVKLAHPDYGIAPNTPAEPPSDTTEIAAELPFTWDGNAGGMAEWRDAVYDVDTDGYAAMRTCPPIVKAVRRLSYRTAKLDWMVVGEGERAEAMQEIFSQAQSWTDLIEWLTWALVEGVRFHQIKAKEARDGSKEPWIVPDFFLGGRKKYNAGGQIRWDTIRMVQVLESQGVEPRPVRTLPMWQFIIHRPGGGNNPEGDTEVGKLLYNAVAKPYNRAIDAGDDFVRLFGVPMKVIQAKMSKVRPDVLADKLKTRAQKLSQTTGGATMGMSNEEFIKLIQADGKGLDGLVNWMRYLESVADEIICQSVLMGGTGLAEAGRTGDTSQHKEQGDDVAFINGVQIAESLNRALIPWIERKNPDLPELAEGEAAPYFWPCNPEEEDEQDIQVVEEDGMGREDLGEVGEEGEEDREQTEREAETFANMQARAFAKATGQEVGGQVALAALSPLPPVH